MKFHVISIGGAIIGLGLVVSSWIRWLIQWHDLSQALFGIAIGIIVVAISWIYNWMRNKEIQLDAQQRQLDAIGALITGNKKEALEEEAAGVPE